MSDLSPKEREFLAAVRKDWGPTEDVKKTVRAGLPLALRSAPELSPDLADAPGPGAGAGAVANGISRGMWGAGAGLVVVGLCVAGLVWMRGAAGPSNPSPAQAAVTPLSVPVAAAPRTAETAKAPADAPAATEAVSLDSLPNAPAQNLSPQKPSALNAQPAPSGSSDTLAEELALLRTAQTALRAGAPADALAALSTHASRFPRGALREERMTLQVLALCDRGDVAGARAAKAELERSAPASSHLQRLTSSCAAR